MQFESFLRELRIHVPSDRLITDELQRFALGTDASFYRLIPKLVVKADHERDIITLLHLSARYSVPVTFRAAGTSLSGQAVTDSVLVTLTDKWCDHKVDPFGEFIHLQPGIIGARVNSILKPFSKKIGPDPASINTCKVGGIVANNASGMCCGTAHNSYHTLKAMRVIFADGSLLDTRKQDSVDKFKKKQDRLLNGLSNIRKQLLKNSDLVEKVKRKYRIKNTTGYGLNALIDFDDPIEILIHLMVGSEGTLGFISEVTLQTVDDLPNRSTTMVAFSDLNACTKTVQELKTSPVDAVELLDYRSINSVTHMDGLPDFARQLPEKGGVLLIDVRGGNQIELEENISKVQSILDKSDIFNSTGFTLDHDLIDKYWKIRKGTFPAVGAVREAGTTVIIEDIAFPIERLAEGVDRLQKLFDQFKYHEAIIFGHALEGNLHFVFTQSFSDTHEVNRYESFMSEVTQMVAVEFGGSLKAEHGTGRNMAPFVALEWGEDAYGLMKQLKQLFDPKGLLNPGVILNDDASAHVKNLKAMPVADDIVDRCIECGFCEPVCPSRNFTLTPRQRIATFREMTRRKQNHEPLKKSWLDQFQYQAVDSCAATGLCEINCPVDINTGDLVLKLRAKNNFKYRAVAKSLARHFAALSSWVRGGLLIASLVQRIFGAERLERLSLKLHSISNARIPVWLSTTPKNSTPIYARNNRVAPTAEDTVVYWASCVSQSMAGSAVDDRKEIPVAVQNVLKKAQLNVVFPQPTRGLCCGQPFYSKGHPSIGDRMMDEVLEALWEASSAGRYPVLSDTSPCALQLRKEALKRGIHLYDSSDFIDRFLVNRLHIEPVQEKVAVHLTCSAQKQGLEKNFIRVLNKMVPNWIQPEDITCCGFAGDKGFTLPELNSTALAPLAMQTVDCKFGISTSRTCEIGLSRHSGLTYYSLFEILDKQSKTFPELK